jgi:uncharacterized GH25 family protein
MTRRLPSPRRLARLGALSCLLPGLACAHDYWLQPQDFWVAPSSADALSIQVGHGPLRQAWPVNPERVVLFRSLSAAGEVDRRGELRPGPTGRESRLTFKTPGIQMLIFQSTPAFSDLPALRFNAYAQEEGLTPALQWRQAHGQAERPGRELYSRRAKALVRVGDPAGPDALVTRPTGLSLEIVPDQNPYTLPPNAPLPVRIYFEGKPLAGATVKLTNLEFDNRPLAVRQSDQDGRTQFQIPRRGTWLINVIWTKPTPGDPRADFETTFSSLTFGYPAAPARP